MSGRLIALSAGAALLGRRLGSKLTSLSAAMLAVPHLK
jgi:hypothetical protein